MGNKKSKQNNKKNKISKTRKLKGGLPFLSMLERLAGEQVPVLTDIYQENPIIPLNKVVVKTKIIAEKDYIIKLFDMTESLYNNVLAKHTNPMASAFYSYSDTISNKTGIRKKPIEICPPFSMGQQHIVINLKLITVEMKDFDHYEDDLTAQIRYQQEREGDGIDWDALIIQTYGTEVEKRIKSNLQEGYLTNTFFSDDTIKV
jgi:hypothetical protein